jgi:hypothetical protein
MTIFNNGGISLGGFANPGIGNMAASKFVPGFTAVTSAAGTTVLTADSNYYQNLLGTTTQTFQLPDATTLLEGTTFVFDNDSTGNLTVVDNASGPIETIPAGASGFVFLADNATVAGTWRRHAFLPASYDFNNTTANFGNATITNAVWNGTTIGTAYGGTGLTSFSAANYALYSTNSSTLTAGTLPVAAGGSGAVTFTANGILYGNGTSPVGVTAAGATGEVLVGNTGGAPSWSAISGSLVSSFQTSLSGLTPSTAITGAVTLAGTLGVTSGGTGTTTTFTAGSVVFAGASGTYTQDNANFFWDDTNNRLGIGTTSPSVSLHIYNATGSNLLSQADASNVINNEVYSNTANVTSVLNLRRARGTTAVPTAVNSSDNVSQLNFSAYGGTNFRNVASIRGFVDTYTSDTNISGLMTFFTNGGSTVPTERMRIDSSGNVGIGTTTPNVKLDVIGSIEASPAATQDGIIIAGRAGGTSSYAVTLTPTTLTASRTITLPDATTTMVGTDTTQTLTNKRVTPRFLAYTSNSATPLNGISSDDYDIIVITGQSTAITSMTTGFTGTPTNGQKLWISITGTTAIAITWGALFEASTIALPTTTVTTNRLDIGFVWNVATGDWRCVAVA